MSIPRVMPCAAVSVASIPRTLRFTPATPATELHQNRRAVHPCEDGSLLVENTFFSFLPVVPVKSRDAVVPPLPAYEDFTSWSRRCVSAETCCVLHDGTVIYAACPDDVEDYSSMQYDVCRAKITARHLAQRREQKKAPPLLPKKLSVPWPSRSAAFSDVFLAAVEKSCFTECATLATVPFMTYVEFVENQDPIRHYFYMEAPRGRKPQWRRLDAGRPRDSSLTLLGCTGNKVIYSDGNEIAVLDLATVTWQTTDIPEAFSFPQASNCVILLDGLLCFGRDTTDVLLLSVGDKLSYRLVPCNVHVSLGGHITLAVADGEVQLHAASYEGYYASAFPVDPLDRLRVLRAPPSQVFLECLKSSLVPGIDASHFIAGFNEVVGVYEDLLSLYEDTQSELPEQPSVRLVAALGARGRVPSRPLATWEEIHGDPVIREIAGGLDDLPASPTTRDLLRFRAPREYKDITNDRTFTVERGFIANGCLPLRATLDNVRCPTAFRLLCRRAWRLSTHFSVEADGAELFGAASCLTARDCSAVVGMKATAALPSTLYAGPGAVVAERSPVAFPVLTYNVYSNACISQSVAPFSGRSLGTTDGVIRGMNEVRFGTYYSNGPLGPSSHMADIEASPRLERRTCAALLNANDAISAVRCGHGAVVYHQYGEGGGFLLSETADKLVEIERVSGSGFYCGTLGGEPTLCAVGGDDAPSVVYSMDGQPASLAARESASVYSLSLDGRATLKCTVGFASDAYVCVDGVFSGPSSLFIVARTNDDDQSAAVLLLEVTEEFNTVPHAYEGTMRANTLCVVGADGVRIGTDLVQATACGLAVLSHSNMLPLRALVPLYVTEVPHSRKLDELGQREYLRTQELEYAPSGFVALRLDMGTILHTEAAAPPLPYDAGSHPFLSALSSGSLARDGYGGHIRNELHVLSVFRGLVQLFQSTFDPQASAPKSLSLSLTDCRLMQESMDWRLSSVLHGNGCDEAEERILALAPVDFTDVFRVKTAMLHGKAQALAMAHCARGIGTLGALLNLVIPHGTLLIDTMRPFLSAALYPIDTPIDGQEDASIWRLWALVAGALAARAPSSRSSVVEHMRALASMPESSCCQEPKRAIAWGSPHVLGPFGHDLAPHEAKRLARLWKLTHRPAPKDQLPAPPASVSFAAPNTTQPKLDDEPLSKRVAFLVLHSGSGVILCADENDDYSRVRALPLVLRDKKAQSVTRAQAEESGVMQLTDFQDISRIMSTPDFVLSYCAMSRRSLMDNAVNLPYTVSFTRIFCVQVGGELRIVGKGREGYGVVSAPCDADSTALYAHYERFELPAAMEAEVLIREQDALYGTLSLQTLPLAPGVALVVGSSTSALWRVDGASMAVTAVDAPANCVYGDALLLGGVLAASKDHAYMLRDLDGEVVVEELAGWSLPSAPSAVCICASKAHYYALAATDEGITVLQVK